MKGTIIKTDEGWKVVTKDANGYAIMECQLHPDDAKRYDFFYTSHLKYLYPVEHEFEIVKEGINPYVSNGIIKYYVKKYAKLLPDNNIAISLKDAEVFTNTLTNPPPPNEALKQAMDKSNAIEFAQWLTYNTSGIGHDMDNYFYVDSQGNGLYLDDLHNKWVQYKINERKNEKI